MGRWGQAKNLIADSEIYPLEARKGVSHLQSVDAEFGSMLKNRMRFYAIHPSSMLLL